MGDYTAGYVPYEDKVIPCILPYSNIQRSEKTADRKKQYSVQEILKENAIFAIVIKALLVFLAMTGYCNLWFAIFLDMVATLFTQLNAIRVTTPSLLHRGKKEIEDEDE